MKLVDRFSKTGSLVRAFFVAAAMLAIVFYGLGYVWHWIIDDAGISFAYARHLAHGDGLVAR